MQRRERLESRQPEETSRTKTMRLELGLEDCRGRAVGREGEGQWHSREGSSLGQRNVVAQIQWGPLAPSALHCHLCSDKHVACPQVLWREEFLHSLY